MGGTAKTSAAVLLDSVARLGDDGGCVDSAACSTAVLGRRWNRAGEEGKKLWRGGMERDGREASPGVARRLGRQLRGQGHVGALDMAGTQQCVPLLEEDDREGEVGLGRG